MEESKQGVAGTTFASSHGGQFTTNQPSLTSSGSNRGTPNTNTIEPPVASRSRAVCRFYNTKKGCRAGDQCPYRHVVLSATAQSQSNELVKNTTKNPTEQQDVQYADAAGSSKANLPNPVKPQDRRPVSKPVPNSQTLDPRDFEISQVVRRYAPDRQDVHDGTILSFLMIPSDPDFPFELPQLHCRLTVPSSYPKDGRPTVRITNKEMARGYQINIERGFDLLVAEPRRKTLLSLLRDLDKNLEGFLSTERAQTIKLVANAPKAETVPIRAAEPVTIIDPPRPSQGISATPVTPKPIYSVQDKLNAKEKRSFDVRQLEARMNRVPAFSKSGNGLTFNIPLQIAKPGRLPVSLQPVKEVTLTVPQLYNLEPCTIKLKGVYSEESQNVEMAFEVRARSESGTNLMAHINYLTQNMHTMAVATQKSEAHEPEISSPDKRQPEPLDVISELPNRDGATATAIALDADRPHLQTIPRPPEWNRPKSLSDGEDESTDSYDEFDTTDSEDEDDGEAESGGATIPSSLGTTVTAERGVQISFPDISYTGIELLEISSMALTLKCERCKTSIDVHDIKPNPSSSTMTRTEPCSKCINTLSISYRSLPLHVNSIRAGYLDLGFCSVLDMLPTKFTPTCSSCSTRSPNPITAVRGDTGRTNTCRTCHAHQTMSLPDVRFLRVSTAPTSTAALPRRRPKENLGIVTGEPLPRHGACRHYSKSHRWFRFSCCNKVFACDKCHDENMLPPTATAPNAGSGSATTAPQTPASNQGVVQAGTGIKAHPNEHANRMICGFCSRKQNYRPEDCGYCGRVLTGRSKTGGFWEGGKGTRDQTRMRRKERRKFKRIGGTAKKD